jgi:hypothetical protein
MSAALILGFILCLVGGLAGKTVFLAIYHFLSGWQRSDIPIELGSVLFSAKDLLKTLIVSIVGVCIFFTLRTKPVKLFLSALASRERSFSGLFYAFFWSIAALLGYILLAQKYI